MTISVFGVPAPQGSKRIGTAGKGGRAILIESSTAVKPWREAVKWATLEVRNSEGHSKDEIQGIRFIGAVSVAVTFFLPKPKSAPAWALPSKKPDIDKLLRSTFDAIGEAGVWQDDSRVVEVSAFKKYAVDRAPGAVIIIERMNHTC
jgi:Holliday junction resolvase RusA-like endonuclease